MEHPSDTQRPDLEATMTADELRQRLATVRRTFREQTAAWAEERRRKAELVTRFEKAAQEAERKVREMKAAGVGDVERIARTEVKCADLWKRLKETEAERDTLKAEIETIRAALEASRDRRHHAVKTLGRLVAIEDNAGLSDEEYERGMDHVLKRARMVLSLERLALERENALAPPED